MNSFWQYLVEIDAWNGSAVETIKLCGPPAFDVGWFPHLVDPGLIQVQMFQSGKTTGNSSYTIGEIVVSNIAEHAIGEQVGPLDFLRTYSFDGRAVRVFQGNYEDAYESFTLVYAGTVESIFFEWQQLSFTIRSRQAELDVKVDAGTFLGNNVLPAGVEGVESDLKDKPKPLLLGRVYNASPALCNTSKLIYAVSPATGIAATYMGAELRVYDNGVPLTFGGVYIDQTDMEAVEPEPGEFKVWEIGGYFRLGSSPSGPVTFDGSSYGRSVTAKMSNLIEDLLALHDKQNMINTTSFTNFADLVRYENGIYLSGSMPNVSEAIDQLCNSCGAFWHFNNNGEIELGRLVDPSTLTTDFELNSSILPVEDFQRQKTQDTPSGAPIKAITLNVIKNYTVMTSFAGSVTDLRKAFLKEEWRTSRRVDESISIAHPLAGEMIINTTFTDDNFDETLRRFALYSVGRDLVQVQVDLSLFGSIANVRPGLCANVNFNNRYGFINKKMMLISYTVNHVDERVTLTLWG